MCVCVRERESVCERMRHTEKDKDRQSEREKENVCVLDTFKNVSKIQNSASPLFMLKFSGRQNPARTQRGGVTERPQSLSPDIRIHADRKFRNEANRILDG